MGFNLFMAGAAALFTSFLAPTFSLFLQSAALVLFLLAEWQNRHEVKYVKPIKDRRYKAWIETLDHAFEYTTGEAQTLAVNRADWHYRRRNQQLNLAGSTKEKYLNLFTGASEPAPAIQPAIQQTQLTNGESKPEMTKKTEMNKSNQTPPLNLESLISTSFLLVFGCPGGGKTSLARRIAKLRAEKGQDITVADPHGSKADWEGWKVVGIGRDYESLNAYLEDFDDAVTADYKRFSEGVREFKPSTLIAEEFTHWADNCSNAPRFIKTACADIRKIERGVILVSHTDTLTGLGNAQGMKAAIDRAAVKIELEAEVGEDGKYTATGYGWIQYPGKDRKRVRIVND